MTRSLGFWHADEPGSGDLYGSDFHDTVLVLASLGFPQQAKPVKDYPSILICKMHMALIMY